jgi:hypothetical protein
MVSQRWYGNILHFGFAGGDDLDGLHSLGSNREGFQIAKCVYVL